MSSSQTVVFAIVAAVAGIEKLANGVVWASQAKSRMAFTMEYTPG